MYIDGIYQDGKTSKRHNARLKVNSSHQITHIYLLEEQQELLFEGQDYQVESRLGKTPREVVFENNQLFTCEHHEVIDQIASWKNNPTNSNFLYRLESNLKAIGVATLASICIIYLTITYGIPATSKFIAHNAPAFTSDQLFSSLDILDKTVFEPSTLPSQEQQRILDKMTPYLAKHDELQAQLVFRSGMKANALALPNGVIVFTDEFVKLAQTDDELVAVLFHELGHLKHKHMTQRIVQDAIMTILVVFITGDVESFDLITGIPTLLVDLAYSREFEIEADTYALSMLEQHKISLKSFVDIMQSLDDYYRGDDNTGDDNALVSFLSTHPPTAQRVALVEKFQ